MTSYPTKSDASLSVKLKPYLASSEYIDWQTEAVLTQAKSLAENQQGDVAIAKACFEFVRDQIKHSWDYQDETQHQSVSLTASETLNSGHGFCYAKSHLLAALLRANNIPCALSYQRLTIGDEPPFCLHGLNAVYLEGYGWYKMDARGNKLGVNAQFNPPQEQLAFTIRVDGEKDFTEQYAEPRADIITKMKFAKNNLALANDLPDID